jgi:CRISPR system Cascade subunit CasA
MMMNNLMTDGLITVRQASGRECRLSLPGVLAAMERDQVRSFSRLLPHQSHPWHAFLCQLAAMCLQGVGVELPDPYGLEPHRLLGEHTEEQWRAMLHGLTPGYENDEPWRLVVEDLSQPAFMQPPAPEDDWGVFKDSTSYPDELDVLVPSKCHGLKFPLQNQPAVEDWMFTLISIQTHGAYMGRGNYGIVRQNGGYATRPGLSLCASDSPCSRWARDVRVIRDHFESHFYERHDGLFGRDGIKLLWLEPWGGGKAEALELKQLDPLFIEVCRRIRLEAWVDDGIRARRAGTKAQRVAGKDLKGNLGDPWIPIKDTGKEPSAFNARPGYQNTQEVLFGGRNEKAKYQYIPALLQKPQEWEKGQDLLVRFRVLLRSDGKTEGYHERFILVPSGMVMVLGQKRETAAEAAKDMVGKVSEVEYKVLKPALVLALQANRDAPEYEQKETTGWVDAKLRALDLEVDEHFFEQLWKCLELVGEQEDYFQPWKSFLRTKAIEHFNRAMDELPLPQALIYKARARAEGYFYGRMNSILKIEKGEANE